jgi:hypothetical protein
LEGRVAKSGEPAGEICREQGAIGQRILEMNQEGRKAERCGRPDFPYLASFPAFLFS